MKSITRCDGGGKYYICNCWSGMRMLIISPLASGPSPDDRQRLQRVRPGPAIIRKFSDSDSVSRYHYLFSWLLLPLKVLGPEQAAGPHSDSGDWRLQCRHQSQLIRSKLAFRMRGGCKMNNLGRPGRHCHCHWDCLTDREVTYQCDLIKTALYHHWAGWQGAVTVCQLDMFSPGESSVNWRPQTGAPARWLLESQDHQAIRPPGLASPELLMSCSLSQIYNLHIFFAAPNNVIKWQESGTGKSANSPSRL